MIMGQVYSYCGEEICRCMIWSSSYNESKDPFGIDSQCSFK